MYSRGHNMALAFAILCAGLTGCGAATVRPTLPAVVPPAPAAPAADAADSTASLRGTVVSDADRTPLARARVVLSSTTLAQPRVMIAAADGTFAFTNLPAGAYSIGATRSGYVGAQFGERRSASPIPVAVNAGQAVAGVEITLRAAGVIAGQVLDEDDKPFTGATVDALVSRTVEGRLTLVSVASAQTDDRGEFRLTGLPAGQFYVSAFDPAFTDVGDVMGVLHYTPTYYPGVALAEQAVRVAVTPGGDPPRVTIKLHIIRPARVAGRIQTPDAQQLITGAVVMRSTYAESVPVEPSQDVTILPDGTFVFRNVPPGHYQIRARGEVNTDSPSLFATFSIRVEGQDIGNLEMTLVPGARVDGRVLLDAPTSARPPQVPGGLRVRAPFVDGSSFGDALTGDVRQDGSYAIRGLMTGNHMITLEGLTPPWVLKSVTWRGQDITDIGITAQAADVYSDVRLTITDVASEMSGIVHDRKGEPVADATVLIIPVSPQFRTRTSRRFRLLRSDARGRYTVRGLPPGDYHALATIEIDDSEAYRGDVLQELAAAGRRISVTDLGAVTMDLPLTSAPQVPSLTSR